ncbi:MAG TPA: hypothetical protein VGN60_00475 [Devosia sp.]|jgi:O6-methylguanine-DNA--protein-cysteine methyltransferase|nr:hypothetical protein [Devosia sp.]
MDTAAKHTLRQLESRGEDATDALSRQIAALRREIAEISEAAAHYSGHTLHDVQHNAGALAREMRQQGAIVARQLNRQASVAGRAIQSNPVPVIVALGTLALLSTLIFMRDDR